MHQCPHCHSTERQVKSGFNRTRSQRMQCQTCRRHYTPAPLPLGYDEKTKEAALKLYLEGNGFRRIGRLLGVNHQSVANWVTAAHARLPAPASDEHTPPQAQTLEVDELFTFVGSKKASIHCHSCRKRVAADRRAQRLRRAHAGSDAVGH